MDSRKLGLALTNVIKDLIFRIRELEIENAFIEFSLKEKLDYIFVVIKVNVDANYNRKNDEVKSNELLLAVEIIENHLKGEFIVNTNDSATQLMIKLLKWQK